MLEVKHVTPDEVVKALLNVAAEMIRGELLPPEFVGDWDLPKSVGKKARRVIQTEATRVHAQAHVWSRKLKSIADSIRKTEREKAREPLASGGDTEHAAPCCVRHCNQAWGTRPMIVCRTCGNKRCPKVSDCGLECTNSNEPGQEGSVY